MPTNQENNKRIAKNTLMLYFRMFITMAVALYTSRVVLATLGATDYGLYNVVGGVVTMFTFLNGAMASATQRYLNVDIAKGNVEHLKIVFRTAQQIHIAIAIVVFILGETVGLWFLCTHMAIPEDRFIAAQWVYQFSVLACMVTIISLPYNACIIAHEKMSAFAYISIMDVTLKLAIVYLIMLTTFDKLIFYAFLILCVQILDRIIYNIYCKRHFEEVNFSFKFDKPLFSEMASFAGWSLWGNMAGVLFTQGVNILLNMFFGPAVNAARGIAVQVQHAVMGFTGNIQVAVNPQITKTYAVHDLDRMHKLMFGSAKFCFYLLFMIVFPLGLEAGYVLNIWLVEVPGHTVNFLRLILIIMLIETLTNPYVIANQATGKVKKYQTICGGLQILIVPVAYIVLKLGGNSESVFIVHGAIAFILMFTRVSLMSSLIDLPVGLYIRKVLAPVSAVVVASLIIPTVLFLATEESFISFLTICLTCVACAGASIYFLGTTKSEKAVLIDKISSVYSKITRSR